VLSRHAIGLQRINRNHCRISLIWPMTSVTFRCRHSAAGYQTEQTKLEHFRSQLYRASMHQMHYVVDLPARLGVAASPPPSHLSPQLCDTR
jgi:hypothetical protein